MLDVQFTARLRKVVRAKRGTVVGEQPFDSNSQRLVIGNGVTHELHRAAFGFIRIHVGKADPRVIIDGHKQKLPAGIAEGAAAITGDPVTRLHEASESLRVDVQQIACRRMLIAQHRGNRLQILQMRQTGTQIKIDYRAGPGGRLTSKVDAIEQKLGRKIST